MFVSVVSFCGPWKDSTLMSRSENVEWNKKTKSTLTAAVWKYKPCSKRTSGM